MNYLTVYFDGQCSLCVRIRNWLETEPQIVALRFVDRNQRSGQADPDLFQPASSADDLIVVSDDGRVWRGDDAWLMVLYALDSYRSWSYRLSDPEYRPLLGRLIGLLSKHRIGLGRWLDRSIPSMNWLLGQARVLPPSSGNCTLPHQLLERRRGF